MKARLEEARRNVLHPHDPTTGEALFHPHIGRPPNYQRNHAGLPVGEYLYGMR